MTQAEYITPECFDLAASMMQTIEALRDQLSQPLTLADKIAIKRDIKRLQEARRIALGATL